MRVAVIGGGPAGLVTLKYLITAHNFFPIYPIEARLFESEASIGGTFTHRAYEDAELVSSRQLTTFSDFRCSDEAPDFLLAIDYCAYLDGYCTRFSLWPPILLSTNATKVTRRQGGGHIISYSARSGVEETWTCDAVAICSGLHVTPNIPPIKGIENVPISMHSSEFKRRQQFGIGKNVMILGSGETGMDLAHLAVTSSTKSVTMSHRDGFFVAPKRVEDPVFFGHPNFNKPLNVPVDVSAASLFDTMYVHPLLNNYNSTLLWGYYDMFIKSALWLISGTKHGVDQWVGGYSDERYHASTIIFNKSSKAMPYISAPYRSDTVINKVRSSIIQIPLLDTKGRKIDLAPWPEFIDEKGVVHFTETGRPEAKRMRDVVCKPDVLIFATGYTQKFPFLDASYPTPSKADIRTIWKSGDETVGFIGFVRPSFGAIPPLSEFQAQLWVLSILGRLPRPLKHEDYYRLHLAPDRRIQYGVDHETYAYRLALDMGSAPSFSQVLARGWKITIVWALGANFNTKFRLVGPWKWYGAEEVMRTELWDTVARRRGLLGHISLLPTLIFGTISLFLYIFCGVVDLLKWVRNVVTMKAHQL